MKPKTLRLNELGQRLKTKLLILCTTIILLSGACKKELYDLNIAPSPQKDRFISELYTNLLKNDAHYHILDQLGPSDKLGWDRMMIRFNIGKTTTSINYVLPVISQGTLSDRLIQFCFNQDNKLINISLLHYNNSLRLPISSDSLNSSYVKNQLIGNTLACMSKDGLVVSDELVKRAASITTFDAQKIAAVKNLIQSKPQISVSPAEKTAGKSISTTVNTMSFNDGSGCTTTVDFDFMFNYSYWNSGTLMEENDNNLVAQHFSSNFFYSLTASGLEYDDLSSSFRNRINFHGLGGTNSMYADNFVRQALEYAANQTGMYLGYNSFNITYYMPAVFTQCTNSDGTPPTERRDFRNNVMEPCIAKTVNALLTSNMDIEGAMSEIIKKFDQNKTVSINIYDGDIYYKDNVTPKPGQITKQQMLGDAYTANITLGKTYHIGTSKENVVTTLIHEVVHAYLGYSSNNFLKTENDHEVIASKYITPMAEYLKSYFGMSLKEAYALAWSGVSDAKVWEDADMDFKFTMSDGNKITKLETIYLSAPYKDKNTDPYAKGTPICQ